MKIKKFNESNESTENDNKYYVFSVPRGSKCYRGSVWSSPKPWIPDDSKLVAEFDIDGWESYMVVDQKDLDEINQIKADIQAEYDAKKYNIL